MGLKNPTSDFCFNCQGGVHQQCTKRCTCPVVGCGFKGKMCRNCYKQEHGKCSMPWCICDRPECQHGYHKVSPMEIAISYFIAKKTRPNISTVDKSKESE